MKDKIIQPEKTDQRLAEDFFKEYTELCEKHQMQLVITPAWKVSQDTGVWGTVLQTAVGKISKIDN